MAVVRGGELVATFASGQRDVGKDLPVTADTLFPIGSSTRPSRRGRAGDAGR
ncbi:MAG: serine hydrolase [Planctomycetes bacterium]|nr:serine hydrolase [Planctomycetota bacterium]